MQSGSRPIVACFLVASLAGCGSATAQSDPKVELVIPTGRALRVTLVENVTLHRVGQTVTARMADAVYAYDRVVLPEGTLVEGTITKLEQPSKLARLRSMSSGDFSPHRTMELRFETVIRDGQRIPIQSLARNEMTRVAHVTARQPQEADTGKVARAKAEVRSRASEVVAGVKQTISDGIATVKNPGKLDRLKEWAIGRLPYHPQALRRGTIYDAELLSSVSLGSVPERAAAPAGTIPEPDSVLSATLTTSLDSKSTPRGSPIEAVVSKPIFADDGRLVLPVGTRLAGSVTFVQAARHFHRNGQLRFLFERVELPNQETAPLLASLHAVDVAAETPVALDDEGGASVKNSKVRFVEPALAVLALGAAFDHGEGGGLDGGATGRVRTTGVSGGGGNPLGRSIGGFIGFGVIGFALSRVSRPLGIAFSVIGVGRSVYTSVFARGQEVRFPADTSIELQLAPGPIR